MYIRVKSFTKCSNLVQSEPFQLQTVILRQHHFFCCKQVFFAKQSFLAKLSSQQKTAIHCKVFLLESSCYTQVALIEGHFFITIVIITVKLSFFYLRFLPMNVRKRLVFKLNFKNKGAILSWPCSLAQLTFQYLPIHYQRAKTRKHETRQRSTVQNSDGKI